MEHKALQTGLAVFLAACVLFLSLALLERQTQAQGEVTIYIETSSIRADAQPRAVGVELGPSYDEVAIPGQILTYIHTLTNTGNDTDTFSLFCSSSQGWATLLTSTPVTVEADATATVQVQISVPTDTVSGTTDIALVRATSQASPTVRASALDRTTVRVHRIYLPVVMRNYSP